MIRVIERRSDLLRFVGFQDEAVTCSAEDYRDRYLPTLDQGVLLLEGDPTVLVLRPPTEYDRIVAIQTSGGFAVAGIGAELRPALALVQRCLVGVEPWPEGSFGPLKDAWGWDSFEKARRINLECLKMLPHGLVTDCASFLLSCLIAKNDAVSDTKKN
jgi:hypothetical protein